MRIQWSLEGLSARPTSLGELMETPLISWKNKYEKHNKATLRPYCVVYPPWELFSPHFCRIYTSCLHERAWNSLKYQFWETHFPTGVFSLASCFCVNAARGTTIKVKVQPRQVMSLLPLLKAMLRRINRGLPSLLGSFGLQKAVSWSPFLSLTYSLLWPAQWRDP